ncbi:MULTISPECIES: phenylalanine--tRNA ligase subunit beta [Ligilactobacillus]|jgi:phenylalanyl-tRNA synthetase beta chain|uniref:phenylalanine--tRNA ligase subunit beta n=1 Tax=Ligilactobacillus TaxID=2767887 RepID=UPI00259811F8|nr:MULTISPECIES: phenylalanine--tRNA ligase subunit beta [Ligilactobacillus]WOY88213.1 phenylalanine--tRNA ligase subunit beta [Ligilactobacillus murinus]
MKVSTKWLNEYVPVADLEPLALAEKIERTAVEVASTGKLEDGLKKIVVGYTLDVKDHPNSDHLHICQVDIGEEEPSQIVCGAPNIKAGQKVIVALPNSRIAGNVKIKRGKMRGEVSEGMICALQELGFSESVVPKEFADGIYVLPEDAKPGEPVFGYLGMDETVIDLDITPNRGDLLSMRGAAHEIAAIYDREVTLPVPNVIESATDEIADHVTVSAPEELAKPYMMRVIKDVKVKESPMWLQTRLWNAGIRPLNNIVDVTNYILLDYGQPLHAFDLDKLGSKQVVVRLAKEGEVLVTLDGEERKLQPNDIVITANDVPVALAGTMGGLDTEISDETTTVALEAAVFDGHRIRKTSRRENLHSEASMRFERGVDVASVREALDAAAAMIAELGEGQVVKGVASVNEPETTPVKIKTSASHINKVLGTELTVEQIQAIFDRLGFETTVAADELTVYVPTRRWDIAIEADLVEEVARIYGYDNLPTTLPAGQTTPGSYTPAQKLIRQARQTLEATGLDQAISYGLTTEEKAKRFALEEALPTNLDFPMSSEHTTVRMNLISGLLDDLAYNAARKVNDVALYEQGRVFFRDEGQTRPREVEHIAGAVTGLVSDANWNTAKQEVDFFYLKGIVANLLHELGVANESYQAVAMPDMHPGRTAAIYAGETYLGFIGEVHPNTAKEYKLKQRVYVFELDLQKVIELPKEAKLYTPVSKYPSITRDIALAVSTDVTNQQIEDCIRKNGGAFLKDIKLFDVYQGEHIMAGFKSLAYTLVYSDPNATLQDEAVTKAFEKVQAKLVEEFEADIR